MPATVTTRVDELRADAQAITNTALAENREPNDDEQARFDALLSAISQLGQLDSSTAAAVAVLERPADQRAIGRLVDFGQAFLDSHVMQGIQAQYPGGVPAAARVTSGSATVGRVSNALLTDPDFTPARHVIDAPTGIAAMDLLQAITVIDDAPTAIRHFTAAFTNVAAAVAEGAAKPEATLAWTPVDLTQGVIAQHIPVTNQALNHNAMLRQIINAFLVNGVRAIVQSTIATQLAAWSGLATQAFDTDLRTTLRKAITKAQTAAAITGSGPIGIALSATDAEELDLEMLATLQTQPGDAPQQVSNIWRANLVVVPSGMANGFAYVGDLKQVIWYTSGDLNVSVGYVNDDFTKNQQRLLAETEGVTGVLNAAAIVKADLTAI